MKNIKIISLILAVLAVCSFMISCGDSNDKNQDDNPPDNSTPSGEDEVYNPYPYDDLSIFMDLPALEEIEITQSEIDDDLNAKLSNLVDSEKLYVKIEEGKAEKWHKSIIDFVGTINGEVFEGGTGKDYSLILGSGSFVPGFEEGVIGMEIGDVKPITFNFPDNYYEELAGKEVTFTVTLKELYEFPEITDEFCEKYTYSKTVEEFHEATRDEYIRNTAYKILLNRCTLKNKPSEFTEYYQSFITYFSGYAQNYNMSLEQFVAIYGDYFASYGLHSGMTLDGFYTVADNYAKSNTVDDLLLHSLVRYFGLKTEGEEFESAKAELLSDGSSYEELVTEYGKTAVTVSIMNIQVLNRLTSYVTVTE